LPQVVIDNYADSAVQIVVRSWVKTEDYWTANFDLKEKIKALFDKEGINIPFPQMDVLLKKVE
jgi:small conductance mechanosensitive channel